MKHFSFTLTVLTLVSSAASDRHRIVEKSLQRTGVECRQYDLRGNCTARCQTLITRDWNDTTGMQSVYDRFFQSDPDDRCNYNRTQLCLRNELSTIPPENKCLRAVSSIQCYLNQYGEVMKDVPKFVPSSRLQEQQVFMECIAMLGLSVPRKVLNDPEYQLPDSRCLLRCFLIRLGLYSDSDGLNLERFYVACGGYDDEVYRNVTQCIANVRASGLCDKCILAHRMAIECIGSQYPTLDQYTLNQHNYADTVINNYNIYILPPINISPKIRL